MDKSQRSQDWRQGLLHRGELLWCLSVPGSGLLSPMTTSLGLRTTEDSKSRSRMPRCGQGCAAARDCRGGPFLLSQVLGALGIPGLVSPTPVPASLLSGPRFCI